MSLASLSTMGRETQSDKDLEAEAEERGRNWAM